MLHFKTWPEPDQFEQWLPGIWSQWAMHMRELYLPVPDRILVPSLMAARVLVEKPPDDVVDRRPNGVRRVEDMANAIYARHHQPFAVIEVWDWRTKVEFGVVEMGLLAGLLQKCPACGADATVVLTNYAPSELCARCRAVTILARRFLDATEQSPVIALLDATELATVGTCRRAWGRKPQGWDSEDWSALNDRALRRDGAIVALLAGLAGTSPQDVSRLAEPKHQRLAEHLRQEGHPAHS